MNGDTVYKETRIKEDGHYVKKDMSAGENMVNAGVTFKVGMHSYVTPTNNSDMTLMEKVKKLEQANDMMEQDIAHLKADNAELKAMLKESLAKH